MGYTPYKMVGHTLPGIKQRKPAAAKMKAFGTKDSEMPDKISTTPTKAFFGVAKGIMEKIKAAKAAKAAKKAKGAAGGEEEVGQAPDPSLMEAEANAVSEGAGEGAGDGGGAVEPHGPEAHVNHLGKTGKSRNVQNQMSKMGGMMVGRGGGLAVGGAPKSRGFLGGIFG